MNKKKIIMPTKLMRDIIKAIRFRSVLKRAKMFHWNFKDYGRPLFVDNSGLYSVPLTESENVYFIGENSVPLSL